MPATRASAGCWDHDDLERFADRMQARFERLAPGFGSLVMDRRILGPRELESRNANLVGGAINGGTAQLHQELVFRPVPGLGPGRDRRARPLPRLGVGPPRWRRTRSAGMNAARAALAHARARRLTGRR